MDYIAGNFVWDLEKERLNIEKHGVDFQTATEAFHDTQRQIFVDGEHSAQEERFFCIGKVGGRVLTVRFTLRGALIRIYGAGYWSKGRREYEQEAT